MRPAHYRKVWPGRRLPCNRWLPLPGPAGVWLLARCADLQNLHYDVRHYGLCLLALFGLGLMFRVAALVAMLTLNRDKQL